VIIRKATEDDMGGIIAMSRMFYPTTHYVDFAPYDENTAFGLIKGMLQKDILLVALDGDRHVGLVGLIVCPFMFNRSINMAHEVIWWVDPEARGLGVGQALLGAIEPACVAAGCDAIQMIHMANSPPQAAAIYIKAGYRESESCYSKRLR